MSLPRDLAAYVSSVIGFSALPSRIPRICSCACAKLAGCYSRTSIGSLDPKDRGDLHGAACRSFSPVPGDDPVLRPLRSLLALFPRAARANPGRSGHRFICRPQRIRRRPEGNERLPEGCFMQGAPLDPCPRLINLCNLGCLCSVLEWT